MAGEPLKVPPHGCAEPPPSSYQAYVQGFQPPPGYPPPGTQPPPPPGFAASAPTPAGAFPSGDRAPFMAWLLQGYGRTHHGDHCGRMGALPSAADVPELWRTGADGHVHASRPARDTQLSHHSLGEIFEQMSLLWNAENCCRQVPIG
ncbi:hypothetical protein HPB51_026578 [Rhipicephalus microplus]|uniref:Uncharacterized protein n=1 Tax=Rhipicephalus microplus TaxID=6941 RepID=A0A9J6D294_RHIMP|nr:hypothetical protein HPB51_026578 [Rhipicephalus microplus]